METLRATTLPGAGLDPVPGVGNYGRATSDHLTHGVIACPKTRTDHADDQETAHLPEAANPFSMADRAGSAHHSWVRVTARGRRCDQLKWASRRCKNQQGHCRTEA